MSWASFPNHDRRMMCLILCMYSQMLYVDESNVSSKDSTSRHLLYALTLTFFLILILWCFLSLGGLRTPPMLILTLWPVKGFCVKCLPLKLKVWWPRLKSALSFECKYKYLEDILIQCPLSKPTPVHSYLVPMMSVAMGFWPYLQYQAFILSIIWTSNPIIKWLVPPTL